MKASKKNKEGRLYFGAESEVELNEWFSDMRVVCGNVETERTKRTSPLHFVNLTRRANALSVRNKNGETPLHCAASLGALAGLDPKMVALSHVLQVCVCVCSLLLLLLLSPHCYHRLNTFLYICMFKYHHKLMLLLLFFTHTTYICVKT
jgi:hypothetical protein